MLYFCTFKQLICRSEYGEAHLFGYFFFNIYKFTLRAKYSFHPPEGCGCSACCRGNGYVDVIIRENPQLEKGERQRWFGVFFCYIWYLPFAG